MEKPDQVRQVIHLQFIASDQHHYFGSISALYEHFSREQIGVAIQTLYNQFKSDIYTNELVILRKGRLLQKKNKKSQSQNSIIED